MIDCLYQEGIRIKKNLVSEQFPLEFENRPDLNLLQILADDCEDFLDVLSDFPITDIAWLTFLVKYPDHSTDNLPITIEKINLSWFQRRLLHRLGPVGNTENSLYLITGKFKDIIYYSVNDFLWEDGIAVVLPLLQPIENVLDNSLRVQLKRKSSHDVISNVFHCVLLANWDAAGGSFIWHKDWVYSNHLSNWAKDLEIKYPLRG